MSIKTFLEKFKFRRLNLETLQLAGAIDDLLKKVDTSIERERTFTAYLVFGRRGIVTSNSVEQHNNTILEARCAPIPDALLMLLNKLQNRR